VAFYWQQERLAENALEIRQIGNKLYESLAGLAQSFQMLGSNLKSSINCYNDTVSRLENSVFYSARKFSELGAAPANKAIKELEPLEISAREIQRAEFFAASDGSDQVLQSRT
jgi:DNA recombination protein RmuC